MTDTSALASNHTFRPLGSYERIGLCRDTCAPGPVLEVMAAWQRAARSLARHGVAYPSLYFPLPNQLLREQTNMNDGNTLRALPDLKTQSGSVYKSVIGAVETHNTPVCRHFMHWLQNEILPQHAFPALEKGEPTGEVNRVKAVMYYVLWRENKALAKRLGETPRVLTDNPHISYDEIKSRASDFAHVTFARKSGKIALHHELVTGIRGSGLWPWNDPYFKYSSGKTKPVLSDFHFNLADLSMLSMFMNGVTQNPGSVNDPRNHLVLFVSNDTDFMREICEYAYGHRLVKPNIDRSGYRKFVGKYNELSAQIERRQQQIRKSGGNAKPDEKAVAGIEALKEERRGLRREFEAPMKLSGPTKSRVVRLLDEEYDRYEPRGLIIARPPPYAERPDILVLSPKRFLAAAKIHAKDVGKLVRTSPDRRIRKQDDLYEGMTALYAALSKLETALSKGEFLKNTAPDSMLNLQKILRERVEQTAK